MSSNLELLTIEEVSEIFKVKPSTIQTWQERGVFPDSVMFKIPSMTNTGRRSKGTKRFIKSKLEEWINNGSI